MSEKTINGAAVRKLLVRQFAKVGSQRRWSQLHQIDQGFACRVANGQALPSTRILSILGLEMVKREPRYRFIGHGEK